MSVGRYARHTLPGYRIATRQEEIYAEDMYGTSPWATTPPDEGPDRAEPQVAVQRNRRPGNLR